MNNVRGVAHQRDALGDEGARGEQPEREGAARAGHLQIAELQAEALFQFVVKFVIRQRYDALGLVRLFRPHDGRAVSRQRQDRERAGGQEMLLGAALVVALMCDRADDGRLAVIPAVAGDAGLLADLRARAVGADQKPRRNRVAVGQRHVDAVGRVREPGHRRAAQIDAELFGFLNQCIDQPPVLDHVRERLALFHLAAEGQERRPHRIVELGVGHHHVEDRLRLRVDRVPDFDRLEQPPRGGRDGGGARVLRLRGFERRIGDRHRKARAQRLAQRDRQRQAGKARPADHHVALCPGHFVFLVKRARA